MSEPEQGIPTYGPPPPAAYAQPSGPPAPPGATPPLPPFPAGPGYPPASGAYPPATPTYPPTGVHGYPATPAYPAAPAAHDSQLPATEFAAPYAIPAPLGFAEPAPVRSGTLGVVALVAGILALVVAPIVAGIASYRIGLGVGREFALRPSAASFDWTLLSPVRDWVLLGEVSFWAGTALGVWAIVQGIVAIVKKRGRGAGIAAVVVAVLGPIAFGIVVNAWILGGVAAGSSLGG